MQDELAIAVHRERGCVIAAVTGEIDISTVGGLRERLFELAEGKSPLIVDLDQVTFIDSAGLGVLVGTSRRVAENGGTLRAICTQPQTRKLLWLTGVDRRIPLVHSLDEALAAASAAPDASG
jgi:anti-sigma B factor antagonist